MDSTSKVLIVIAVVALAGGAGYMYYYKKEEEKEEPSGWGSVAGLAGLVGVATGIGYGSRLYLKKTMVD